MRMCPSQSFTFGTVAAGRGWVGKVLRVAMSGLLSCKSTHKGPTPIGHGGDMWSDISTVRFPQRDSNTMNQAERARHGIRKTAERRWPRRPGPYLHFSFEEIDQLDDQDDYDHQLQDEGAALVELLDHEAVKVFSGVELFLDEFFVVGNPDFLGAQLVK